MWDGKNCKWILQVSKLLNKRPTVPDEVDLSEEEGETEEEDEEEEESEEDDDEDGGYHGNPVQRLEFQLEADSWKTDGEWAATMKVNEDILSSISNCMRMTAVRRRLITTFHKR